MKRLLLPLAILASTALLVTQKPPEVQACSTAGDFDLVRDSDVIVSGMFTGWEIIEDATRFDEQKASDPAYISEIIEDPKYYGFHEPIRVEMAVDRVYKGSAPEVLHVIDGASLEVFGEEPKYSWVGSSGACGAFDSDPTGTYAVVGLWRREDGTYRAFTGSWFYSGETPPTEYTDLGLRRLQPLLPGHLPEMGGPPGSPQHIPFDEIAIAGALGLLAFLVGTAFVWRRGEPHSG